MRDSVEEEEEEKKSEWERSLFIRTEPDIILRHFTALRINDDDDDVTRGVVNR